MSSDEDEHHHKPSRKEFKKLVYEARKNRILKPEFELVNDRGYKSKYSKYTPTSLPDLSTDIQPLKKPKKAKKCTTKEQLSDISTTLTEIKAYALKNSTMPYYSDELDIMRLLNTLGNTYQDIKRFDILDKSGLPIPDELADFVDRKILRMSKRHDRLMMIPEAIITNKITPPNMSTPKVYTTSENIRQPTPSQSSPIGEDSLKVFDYKTVTLNRPQEINATRLKLPSVMMESDIIDSILYNHVTVITGDTGCGKSTQIPQFLYEKGFCSQDRIIGVTQPRRVACLAVYERVKSEIGDESLIGFQMRNHSGNSSNCRIKFMTEGIMLQEIRNDLLCSKYSAIIIDEAHERSLNTDIIIGILSRVIQSRQKRFESHGTIPLKLVIMSASINVEHYINSLIFKNLKIKHIHIPTHSKPSITIHYLKKTNTDYLAEAKKAVIKIHTKFPRGSILVFTCGKDEIRSLTRALEKTEWNDEIKDDHEEPASNSEESDTGTSSSSGYPEEQPAPNPNNPPPSEEGQNKDMEVGLKSTSKDGVGGTWEPLPLTAWLGSDGTGRLKIIPLHASQSPREQKAAFQDPNSDERIVIISTNVAETSITLPNIRYVVDCGKEKRRSYTCGASVSKYVIGDISQSSANQRAGRAGRLGPGHCYRMYSSTVYSHIFKPYTQPEIDTCPLDGTVLFLSSLGIFKLDAFPFLTPPKLSNIKASVNRLVGIDALEAEDDKTRITMMGKAMSEIPIEPRYARMILIAISRWDSGGILWHTCLVAAGLSLGLMLDRPYANKYDNDILFHLNICLEYLNVDTTTKYSWCKETGVNYKSISSIVELASLLIDICANKFLQGNIINRSNEVSDNTQLLVLYEVVLNGLIDQIALFDDTTDCYTTLVEEIKCKIHPASCCNTKKHRLVAYNSIVESKGYYLNGVMPVDKEMIARINSTLVETSGTPQTIPPPIYIPEIDSVVGYVSRVYKPTNLNLGVIRYPIKCETAIRCFGNALTSGKVYGKINKPDLLDDVIQQLVELKCYNKYILEEKIKLGGKHIDKLKTLLDL